MTGGTHLEPGVTQCGTTMTVACQETLPCHKQSLTHTGIACCMHLNCFTHCFPGISLQNSIRVTGCSAHGGSQKTRWMSPQTAAEQVIHGMQLATSCQLCMQRHYHTTLCTRACCRVQQHTQTCKDPVTSRSSMHTPRVHTCGADR